MTSDDDPVDLAGVDAVDVPRMLADLHRSLPVDAVRTIRLTPPDTAPGLPTVEDLVVGAGFGLEGTPPGPGTVGAVTIRRLRSLPDTVGPDLALLVCGLNPSLHAADAGVGFVSPSNRFWPAARAAGVTSADRDPWHALDVDGVGMTDLVKRATRRADELSGDEYRAGLGRLDRLCRLLRPAVVAIVGLSGWRAAVDRSAPAGPAPRRLGDAPVWVLPSSSGLNAHTTTAALADHLRAAIELGRESATPPARRD